MSNGHWQLEGSAAQLYERYLVPAITAKWATDLLDRAQPSEAERVLDIACGTGVVARMAAKRLSRGHITGLDMNPGMLAIAQTTATNGPMITWIEGSALDLPFRSETFDVVLCQLGLQFFPDQGKAVAEMYRVLEPKGRVALSVYSAIERTPGAYAFVLALEHVMGPAASRIKRGEHSFTEPARLKALLTGAGFVAVDVHTVEKTIVFPSVLDYVGFQLLATPMTVLLTGRSEHEVQAIISSIENKTTALSSPEMLEGGRFTFQQQAYVAIGHRPG